MTTQKQVQTTTVVDPFKKKTTVVDKASFHFIIVSFSYKNWHAFTTSTCIYVRVMPHPGTSFENEYTQTHHHARILICHM